MEEWLREVMQAPLVVLAIFSAAIAIYATDDGRWTVGSALVCIAAYVTATLGQLGHTAGRIRTVGGCLVIIALTTVLYGDACGGWYMNITWWTAGLICAAALSTIWSEMHTPRDAHSVRKLVYRISLAAVIIVGTLNTTAIVEVLRQARSPYPPDCGDLARLLPNTTAKTTTYCSTNATSTNNGILLSNEPFVDHCCPSHIWESLRVNTIMGASIYTMFTLTTSLHEKAGTEAVAAIVECLMWTAASVLQFDTIQDSHQLRLEVLLCIIVASLFYTYRAYIRRLRGSTANATAIHGQGHHMIDLFSPPRPQDRTLRQRLGATRYSHIRQLDF